MTILKEMLAYLVFVAIVGLLSAWPDYKLLNDDRAIISIVFSHAGQRMGDCRMLTQEELNKLPPNMRKPNDCPRERYPIEVKLLSGDSLLYSAVLPPSGIWSDGKSSVYQRIEVEARRHELHMTMVDSERTSGYDYVLERTLDVQPGQNLVIQFNEERKSFVVE
ncbi:MAG: hypothetical protein K0U72_16110 [Gammaproteobacteria bacterium]|nr:hypothetical protein [Gammaproteobacteria bacterium]